MAAFNAILILLAAVLLSSLINQFVPRLSTPLVQLLLGVVVALIFPHFNIKFEPEMLMLVFISPLLFDEARKSDRRALWQLKWPILSLAVGLVFVEVLALGWLLNYLVAGLSLAAAFALAAALGPTDAVAVTSLGERASIPHTSEQVLAGEALINDASGIIAFQFALAAALTGKFSLAGASQNFLLVFFGGLAVGAAVGIGRAIFVRWVRGIGLEDITFHIIIEILTPFLAYLIADALRVSGILAVVAAGIGIAFRSKRRTAPDTARQNLVSSSVWSVISFTLNGLVFLLLGTELPSSLRAIRSEGTHGLIEMLGYILLATVVLYVLRALWVSLLLFLGNRRRFKAHPPSPSPAPRRLIRRREQNLSAPSAPPHTLRNLLILTFAGARGAVALGVALTIPVMIAPGTLFPERNMIIFVAAGVIVLTLVVANFVLPALAPATEAESSAEAIAATVKILQEVIDRLDAEQTADNRLATRMVIHSYQDRISSIQTHNDTSDAALNALRLQALDWEQEHADELLRTGAVSKQQSLFYHQQLQRARSIITHHHRRSWVFTILGLLLRRSHALSRVKHPQAHTHEQESKFIKENRDLRIDNYHFVVARLVELQESGAAAADFLAPTLAADTAATCADPAAPAPIPRSPAFTPQDVETVLAEYRHRLERFEGDQLAYYDRIVKDELHQQGARMASRAQTYERNLNNQLAERAAGGARANPELTRSSNQARSRALEYEREAINQAASDERISRQQAQNLRDNISYMELDLSDEV